MTVDKVFYTNGHDVMVTDSAFLVKKKQYRLLGIIRHGFKTIKPVRTPWLILAVVGAIVATLANFRVITMQLPDVFVWNRILPGTLVMMTVGACLMITGLSFFFAVKKKYAVHISTAEGDDDVIVSKEREYIAQIVRALSRAIKQSVVN